MFNFVLKMLFGTKNARYLKQIAPVVTKINALESYMQGLSDDAIREHMQEYKQRHVAGESLDALLPEVYALVREASKRVLGMRHYDVQLMGGIAMHQGNIVEMRTGEGKTLIATLPASLNALTGKGVHVVTVNDYLAKRDAAWMGELYTFLGLSVGVIVQGLTDEERKVAYNADITYGTNNEIVFDFLRDNMKYHKEQLVQRGQVYAIIDEVDSILIDEARTPLIISGPSGITSSLYQQVDSIAHKLEKDKDFTLDEKHKTVLLTDVGIQQLESLLQIDNLFDVQHITLQHHILQALRAIHLYRRDIEYIVKDGKILIVDEFTGRLMEGRRFGDGLHQAIEAKEGVKIEAENQTLANITFQKYFLLYEKLSGMTGTADTEAVEFKEIYNLDVIVIPTNKPVQRKDLPDCIYRTKKEKFKAIVNEIERLHAKGVPVLVGTASIENSEYLSRLLQKKHIPHNVLNAKHHEKEAEIIADAGKKGKVTIATNMAGRGTDIMLGEGVKELGGLFVIGTERHESRRIDNQLRGRSGRQGDPGQTQFYLSLEDDLMRLFGSERIANIMQRLGLEEGEAIQNKIVTRAIENAQRKIEAHYFEMRKTIFEYDNVLNQQREVIYSLRRNIMEDDALEEVLQHMQQHIFDDLLVEDARGMDEEALLEYKKMLQESLGFVTEEAFPKAEVVKEYVQGRFVQLKHALGENYFDVVRYFAFEAIDQAWKEHLLAMECLREGIGLRGYGQKDPKQEYKREGFLLFQEMLKGIYSSTIGLLVRIDVSQESEATVDSVIHRELPNESVLRYSSNTFQSTGIAKNALCHCGSGKKYKRCCGKE